MKDNGCFCIFSRQVREKHIDNVKVIMRKIVKEYTRTIIKKEKIIGYEYLPVYREEGNTLLYDNRNIRIYYLD